MPLRVRLPRKAGRPPAASGVIGRPARGAPIINTGTDNTATAVFPATPSPAASVNVVARSPFRRPAATGNALPLHAYFRLLPQKNDLENPKNPRRRIRRKREKLELPKEKNKRKKGTKK